jgi:hypothetical protein
MLMAAAILWVPAASPDADVAANPAFSAVIAYMVVYLLMNLGAFGCVALVYWATGKETLDAFNGLGRRAPLLAVVMAICLFSLVGLPPFGGFIAKWYLLLALFDAKLIWLVFVAVFNTLISLYYYARIAYAMYFTDDGQPAMRRRWVRRLSQRALGILLMGTFAAGRLKISPTPVPETYAQRATPPRSSPRNRKTAPTHPDQRMEPAIETLNRLLDAEYGNLVVDWRINPCDLARRGRAIVEKIVDVRRHQHELVEMILALSRCAVPLRYPTEMGGVRYLKLSFLIPRYRRHAATGQDARVRRPTAGPGRRVDRPDPRRPRATWPSWKGCTPTLRNRRRDGFLRPTRVDSHGCYSRRESR